MSSSRESQQEARYARVNCILLGRVLSTSECTISLHNRRTTSLAALSVRSQLAPASRELRAPGLHHALSEEPPSTRRRTKPCQPLKEPITRGLEPTWGSPSLLRVLELRLRRRSGVHLRCVLFSLLLLDGALCSESSTRHRGGVHLQTLARWAVAGLMLGCRPTSCLRMAVRCQRLVLGFVLEAGALADAIASPRAVPAYGPCHCNKSSLSWCSAARLSAARRGGAEGSLKRSRVVTARLRGVRMGPPAISSPHRRRSHFECPTSSTSIPALATRRHRESSVGRLSAAVYVQCGTLDDSSYVGHSLRFCLSPWHVRSLRPRAGIDFAGVAANPPCNRSTLLTIYSVHFSICTSIPTRSRCTFDMLLLFSWLDVGAHCLHQMPRAPNRPARPALPSGGG